MYPPALYMLCYLHNKTLPEGQSEDHEGRVPPAPWHKHIVGLVLGQRCHREPHEGDSWRLGHRVCTPVSFGGAENGEGQGMRLGKRGAGAPKGEMSNGWLPLGLGTACRMPSAAPRKLETTRRHRNSELNFANRAGGGKSCESLRVSEPGNYC